MSKVVRGVVDLPHVDLKDTEGILETILFLTEHGLLSDYFNKAKINVANDGITLSWRPWEFIKITSDGHVQYDDHYGTMSKAKDELLFKLNEFYPPVKRLLDLLEKAGLEPKRENIQWDAETEDIVVELQA